MYFFLSLISSSSSLQLLLLLFFNNQTQIPFCLFVCLCPSPCPPPSQNKNKVLYRRWNREQVSEKFLAANILPKQNSKFLLCFCLILGVSKIYRCLSYLYQSSPSDQTSVSETVPKALLHNAEQLNTQFISKTHGIYPFMSIERAMS